MGKISDALERQQNEKEIKVKMLHPEPGTQDHESQILNNIDSKLLVCSTPGSIEAENFKTLKGHILFAKDGVKPRTIMVTSAIPGEGKTFVAANLAVNLAQGINEHALLIDCDLHHPSLHNLLGYSNREGLQDYLAGKMELEDLLIRTKIDKLSLLTAGTPTPNPSELLTSRKMKEFFEEVKGRYSDRYIVVDCPPAHILSEVSILANYVDSVIFVVLAQKAPREIISKCIENVGKDNILGIVFNGYDTTSKTYSNYYEKYYRGKS